MEKPSTGRAGKRETLAIISMVGAAADFQFSRAVMAEIGTGGLWRWTPRPLTRRTMPQDGSLCSSLGIRHVSRLP